MIRSWLSRHVFFPVQDALRGRGSLCMWRALEESQWWDADRLRDLQSAKLKELVVHAAGQAPFYRQRLRQAGEGRVEPGRRPDV